MSEVERIAAALELASRFGCIDGDQYKMWAIDQIVRVLTGSPLVQYEVFLDAHRNASTAEVLGKSAAYQTFVADHNVGEDGPDTYEWDSGTAP